MVILLAEDEIKLAEYIKDALEKEHFTVEVAADGEQAIKKISVNDYDLIILDVMLPKKDGFEVVREMRELKLNTPVLILTAKKLSDDKIKGLNLGADDYMVKPFEMGELLARIRALVRRSENLKPNKLEVSDLVLDTLSHEVYRGGQAIKLTSKEYRILEYLLRHADQVCTRTMINEHIWGFNYVKSNVIDVYITRLRQKIDAQGQKPLIQTIHGTGYKIRAYDE